MNLRNLEDSFVDTTTKDTPINMESILRSSASLPDVLTYQSKDPFEISTTKVSPSKINGSYYFSFICYGIQIMR